jgi:hypothetical protein
MVSFPLSPIYLWRSLQGEKGKGRRRSPQSVSQSVSQTSLLGLTGRTAKQSGNATPTRPEHYGQPSSRLNELNTKKKKIPTTVK